MSSKPPIRVYVTHVFSEHPDYLRVFEYLESVPNFFYVNCSAPENVPTSGGKEALKEEFRNQIKPAEVVVVPGSMYAENGDSINYQMDVAQANELPLVVLEPFGGVEKLVKELEERADEVVGWNDRMIVDAIRRQARHEETTRWDVIEFDM